MSFSKRLHATRVKAFLKKLSVLRLAFMLVSKPPRKQTAPPDVSRPPSIVYDISPAQVQDASCLLPPLSSQPNELPSFMIDFGFDGTGEASVVSPPIDAYPPKLAAAADVTLPLKASIKTYHLPTRGIAKNMETELVHRIQVLEQELATERQRFQTSRSACLCGSSSSSAQPCTNTDKNPLSSNTILTIPSEPSSLEDEMTPALCSVPSISSIDALPHLDPAATSSPENHSPDMTWALNHNENYGLETVWTHGPAVFLLDPAKVYQTRLESAGLRLDTSHLSNPPFAEPPFASNRFYNISANSCTDREPATTILDKDLPPLPPDRKRSFYARFHSQLYRRSAPAL